jgi:hypothetical protein
MIAKQFGGFEHWKMQTLTVVEVVLTGFCSFLKLDKLHHDLAKPPLVLPHRLQCSWNDLNFE